MGVYSTNRSNLGPVEVVAAEGYHGNIGVAQIMIEACQNDQAFFEAVISNDFREAYALSEGTILESELLVVSEASFGGFIDKIKELLSKLLEKIKGIYAALKAKIQNVFIRDNKNYVEKYKAVVLKKDLSKMKYKMSASTGKSLGEPKYDFSMSLDGLSGYKTPEDVQKYINDTFGEDKAVEKALASTLGGKSVTASTYSKEAHDYMFKEAEEVEGLSASELSNIMSNLVTAKDAMAKADKDYKAAEKKISEDIKSIEKSRGALSKYAPSGDSGSVDVQGKEASFGNKGERDALNSKLNALYKGAVTAQTIQTKFVTASIEAVKFALAQDRRIFAQAAAYSEKTVKESAELMDMVAEASDYEVESCFDSYEFA